MTNENYNMFGKVFGRVQGVGFRAWTKKTAQKHNLNGWVMNLWNLLYQEKKIVLISL